MAAIKDGGIKMSLQGKKVLVVGTGKSGIAATELLCANGIDTVLFDGNKELDSKTLYEKAPKLKEVPLILGDLTDEQIDEFDVAVLSPGVPTDIPMVNALRDRGVKIWGEIELAYTFGAGEIIAITGTNGKTTTTALTGEIMKGYYESSFVVGNIGIPYTSVALDTKEDSVTTAEISSFQLETIVDFKPDVCAVLNITPDHLDRHGTVEVYAQTKESIGKNQTKDQVMVLNRHAKYLLVSICKNNIVFSEATVVFALSTFSELAILNSSFHDVWAWKNSSTMGVSTLRYSGTNAFETFPFPTVASEELNDLGNKLHITRLRIMKHYQLGLTDLQNIFHDIQLNNKTEIYDDIIQLRELYKLIDSEIIKLYKWNDIDLKHSFYELDHLPEKDRTRFTIQPTVKKEILKRLLLLNLEQSKSDNLGKKRLRVVSKNSTNTLFPED